MTRKAIFKHSTVTVKTSIIRLLLLQELHRPPFTLHNTLSDSRATIGEWPQTQSLS